MTHFLLWLSSSAVPCDQSRCKNVSSSQPQPQTATLYMWLKQQKQSDTMWIPLLLLTLCFSSSQTEGESTLFMCLHVVFLEWCSYSQRCYVSFVALDSDLSLSSTMNRAPCNPFSFCVPSAQTCASIPQKCEKEKSWTR